jgi:hypothetical protein
MDQKICVQSLALTTHDTHDEHMNTRYCESNVCHIDVLVRCRRRVLQARVHRKKKRGGRSESVCCVIKETGS